MRHSCGLKSAARGARRGAGRARGAELARTQRRLDRVHRSGVCSSTCHDHATRRDAPATRPAPAGARRGREKPKDSVRELVVRERLEALARDAAERLRELVRSGEEIPFAVAGPGDGSPFAQYVPQTDRFVREHWAELAALDAFGEACAAIGASSLGAPYLDSLGEPVPPSEDRCCEAAAIAFLTRLWEGSPEFSFDDERLAAALDEIDGRARHPRARPRSSPRSSASMPAKRLSLPRRRSSAPTSSRSRTRSGAPRNGRSGFEPQFLAVVQGSIPTGDADADDRAGGANAPGAVLRELVTVLRLFKPGASASARTRGRIPLAIAGGVSQRAPRRRGAAATG